MSIFRKFINIEGITAKEFRKDRINILDYTCSYFYITQCSGSFLPDL